MRGVGGSSLVIHFEGRGSLGYHFFIAFLEMKSQKYPLLDSFSLSPIF